MGHEDDDAERAYSDSQDRADDGKFGSGGGSGGGGGSSGGDGKDDSGPMKPDAEKLQWAFTKSRETGKHVYMTPDNKLSYKEPKGGKEHVRISPDGKATHVPASSKKKMEAA